MVLGHRMLIKKKMQDKRNIVYTVQDLKPAFNVNISSDALSGVAFIVKNFEFLISFPNP